MHVKWLRTLTNIIILSLQLVCVYICYQSSIINFGRVATAHDDKWLRTITILEMYQTDKTKEV